MQVVRCFKHLVICHAKTVSLQTLMSVRLLYEKNEKKPFRGGQDILNEVFDAKILYAYSVASIFRIED